MEREKERERERLYLTHSKQMTLRKRTFAHFILYPHDTFVWQGKILTWRREGKLNGRERGGGENGNELSGSQRKKEGMDEDIKADTRYG